MNKKIYAACALVEIEQHITMVILNHGLASSEAEAEGLAIRKIMKDYDAKIISVKSQEIPQDLIEQVYPQGK